MSKGLSYDIRRGNSTPADERLADAARDLLAACKEVRDALLAVDGLVSDPHKKDGWNSPDSYAAFAVLDAAIAKAGGQS